jgi:hypothetical protein
MPRKTNGPMEDAPQTDRSSRRDVLKGALVLLGASVLLQPNGGVSGSALAQDTTGTAAQKKPTKKKCGSAHPPPHCPGKTPPTK